MDIIGKLYRTVTVSTNASSAADAGGGHSDTYTDLLTIRAEIRPSGGGRSLSFGEIMGSDSYVITTRYQAALWAAINMSMKFTSEGLVYTLQSFDRKDDKRKAFIIFNVTLQRNG